MTSLRYYATALAVRLEKHRTTKHVINASTDRWRECLASMRADGEHFEHTLKINLRIDTNED